MAKVVIALSGGVDSAVAAWLLLRQGHEVRAVFMRNWDDLANQVQVSALKVPSQNCPQETDYQDALKVAQKLGIELTRVDFVDKYWNEVFQNLIQGYRQGYTPNPDVWCNRLIKFGALWQWIRQNWPDQQFLATGHYARNQAGQLHQPLDQTKDQTYFLAQTKAEQFAHVLFPLADYTKEKVREIARQVGLEVASKKDSTGICFVGNRKFTLFLENYLPKKSGDIVDLTTLKKIGQHQGVAFYTIGQREGLNLGGQSERYYVVGKNVTRNILYVAPLSDSQFLLSQAVTLKKVNWLVDDYRPQKAQAKFRYRSSSVDVSLTWEKDRLRVDYPTGHWAVTPGQQCVLYADSLCLGAGEIDQVFDQKGLKNYLL
ncbi:tRNA 2-thiouridine(34) synthase MnmA [Mycoplasma sp. ATU-Cv-703]|uniref:tRNA 2-thiouridine(34) synthase MnmA n=1 Tax=Mycoplasma sp. ATU-Cv-703 TaxID=2498595 RepID=UPI000FDE01F2